MPLVKNTTTGNNYLVKINTDADTCSRTAIRSYNKQLGSQGLSGRTRFTLPFDYEPGSHTLWVFVNGEKAVVEQTPVNNRQYSEYSVRVVQFGASQNPTDVLEFIVAGSYLNETDLNEEELWQVVSTDTLATDRDMIMVNTSSSIVTITLPAIPILNDKVTVSDYAGTFNTNNCNIARNGSKIMGLSSDLVLSVNNVTTTLVYIDGVQGWKVI